MNNGLQIRQVLLYNNEPGPRADFKRKATLPLSFFNKIEETSNDFRRRYEYRQSATITGKHQGEKVLQSL